MARACAPAAARGRAVELHPGTWSARPTRPGRRSWRSRATARARSSPSARWPTAPPGWPARSTARGVARGRRGDDPRRQPARVGGRPAGLLADRRGGAALHRAAAPGRPARADGRRRARARGRRRARRRGACARRASTGRVLEVPDPRLLEAAPAPAAELEPDDPALIVFTSGTSGEPKPIRHGQRYLFGQAVQAEHWFGAREGELAWCTAASGWSKSARNSFIAPVAARRRRAAARRPLRPRRAARAGGARGRGRALHGADRVPRDRQARRAAPAARPAPRGGRRRAAQPRGRARLAGGRRAWRCTTATGRPRPAR